MSNGMHGGAQPTAGRAFVRPDRHQLAGAIIEVARGPHRCALQAQPLSCLEPSSKHCLRPCLLLEAQMIGDCRALLACERPCLLAAAQGQTLDVWHTLTSSAPVPQPVACSGLPAAVCRGYRGRVVSATDTHVRMELEAAYRTVNVKASQARAGWLCCCCCIALTFSGCPGRLPGWLIVPQAALHLSTA